MAKKKTSVVKKVRKTNKEVSVSNSYLDRIENEIQSNQSKVSMVLGALIILVIGVLLFNYFTRNDSSLGPAQQIEAGQDVSPTQLPGKYTVKEGDTLFTIAEKYYQDGYKYTEIAKANNLENVDQIEAGQVLEIPKIDQVAEASPVAVASPSEQPETTEALGTGGGDSTIWGSRIEGNTYTVVAGDWLSTIAGRAYGDITAFDKIAKANNIADPDLIEPGTVLNLPR